MTDIIRLLPDVVANQIAAGEVIQRPASALKELLENSIDAGASEIEIIIKDAGKTLIQVIDDGCGMSRKDAMICFSRHATSKIRTANDLFAIHTLGFRGEALASVAAVAQVELKTKRKEDELGTEIVIEGSNIKSEKSCTCKDGTSVAVKNLFFNVPARRNFLKSNSAEIRHIIDEFFRVALVHHNISFSLKHNNKPLFKVNKSGLKERITALFGSHYKERLIPFAQDTGEIKISGFIGKPEFSRKTRGEQYFFANKRFIKHAYLHHSVENAMQELMPHETYPSYFIYIEVDPRMIDVNIHPTKTEVNFQNNQVLYALVRSSIKQSLSQHNITPSIDFEVEASLDLGPPPEGKPIKNPFYREESNYNPFEQKTGGRPKSRIPAENQKNWHKLYEDNELKIKGSDDQFHPHPVQLPGVAHDDETGRLICQVDNRYILARVKSGIMLIDQQRAHERILYEKYVENLNKKQSVSQQELFPQNVTFAPTDAEIIKEITEDLKILGFELNHLKKNTFIINGSPSELPSRNLQELLENVLESYKRNLVILNLGEKVNLARSMAQNMAIRPGKSLSREEMERLIDDLFACKVPDVSPGGHVIITMITLEMIEKMFKK